MEVEKDEKVPETKNVVAELKGSVHLALKLWCAEHYESIGGYAVKAIQEKMKADGIVFE